MNVLLQNNEFPEVRQSIGPEFRVNGLNNAVAS